MRWYTAENIETERSSPVKEINRPEHDLLDCAPLRGISGFPVENNTRYLLSPDMLNRENRKVWYSFRELR